MNEQICPNKNIILIDLVKLYWKPEEKQNKNYFGWNVIEIIEKLKNSGNLFLFQLSIYAQKN